jgi:hypothetical protein
MVYTMSLSDLSLSLSLSLSLFLSQTKEEGINERRIGRKEGSEEGCPTAPIRS